MICDICNAEHGELWGFSTAEFHERTYDIHHPAQEWAVCDICRELMQTGDSEGFFARMPTTDPHIRKILRTFFGQLMVNISGPMVKCQDQHSPLYQMNKTAK